MAPPVIPWLDVGVPPLGLTPCPDGSHEITRDGMGYGHGVAAINATVDLERFAIAAAGTCGVFIANDAESPERTELDLRSGAVTESAIGACVQIDGYDVDRLTSEVTYSDNGVNLDATMLPVPMSVDAIP